jgi:hypothetical protein
MGCETVFTKIRSATPLHLDSFFEFDIFSNYGYTISEHGGNSFNAINFLQPGLHTSQIIEIFHRILQQRITNIQMCNSIILVGNISAAINLEERNTQWRQRKGNGAQPVKSLTAG